MKWFKQKKSGRGRVGAEEPGARILLWALPEGAETLGTALLPAQLKGQDGPGASKLRKLCGFSSKPFNDRKCCSEGVCPSGEGGSPSWEEGTVAATRGEGDGSVENTAAQKPGDLHAALLQAGHPTLQASVYPRRKQLSCVPHVAFQPLIQSRCSVVTLQGRMCLGIKWGEGVGLPAKVSLGLWFFINKTDFLWRDGELQTYWERECYQVWKEFVF